MTAEQLDMFNSPEYEYLNTKVEKCSTSADNVRKGVFARVDSIKKEYGERLLRMESQLQELHNRLENLLDTPKAEIVDLQAMM